MPKLQFPESEVMKMFGKKYPRLYELRCQRPGKAKGFLIEGKDWVIQKERNYTKVVYFKSAIKKLEKYYNKKVLK